MALTKRETIGVVIIGILVIAIGLIVFTGRTSTPDKELHEQFVSAIRDLVEMNKHTMAANADLREELVIQSSQHKRNADSILEVVLRNQAKYININRGYEAIPINIKRIAGNDDSIRAAFAKRP